MPGHGLRALDSKGLKAQNSEGWTRLAKSISVRCRLSSLTQVYPFAAVGLEEGNRLTTVVTGSPIPLD